MTFRQQRKPDRPKKALGASGKQARSLFEIAIANHLENDANELGYSWDYESADYKYQKPLSKLSTYTPDFKIITRSGKVIFIEAKGRFRDLAEYKKVLWVQEQHPDIEIRFLFQNSMLKHSPSLPLTYGTRAEKDGFRWAHGSIIPKSWLEE